MKKFLLVVFFLLFGITTTTTFADVAAAPADSAVAANEIDTLEWVFEGGPAVLIIHGVPFSGGSSSGSFSIRGITADDIDVRAAEGYILKSKGVYTMGNRLLVYAEIVPAI